MKEGALAIIITGILLLIGGLVFSLQLNLTSFNFYKSELTINGSHIQEKIYYTPDQNYHTLFRNFQSYIASPGENISNSISIKNVYCSSGTPYYKTFSGCYDSNSIPSNCMNYTEINEYGCTFGNDYGFKKGENYWIESYYKVNPENLFEINSNYYIKFIAYGANAHKKLVFKENFIVKDSVIVKEKYHPDEQVIIYILYKENTQGINIIKQEGFEFDDKLWNHMLIHLICLLPGILFFFIWFFFGKENSSPNIPERLSMYPNKRGASEVAVFFNLPFGSASPSIIPTLLTDFYHRKIIDIKTKEKELYVKINKNNSSSLNEIEKGFMKILRLFEEDSKKKKEVYFLLDYSKVRWENKNALGKLYSNFSSSINKEKKEYISDKGPVLWITGVILLSILSSFLSSMITLGFVILSGLLIFISSFVSILLIKFKKDYYKEYREWQSFREFLKESPSMKMHGHKGTVLWGEFLVYATALGVAKKVLEEMKKQKIITEQQYNTYFIICYPSHLSNHTGGFTSSSGGVGGGFSGAGAGGVGGGGGGGR